MYGIQKSIRCTPIWLPIRPPIQHDVMCTYWIYDKASIIRVVSVVGMLRHNDWPMSIVPSVYWHWSDGPIRVQYWRTGLPHCKWDYGMYVCMRLPLHNHHNNNNHPHPRQFQIPYQYSKHDRFHCHKPPVGYGYRNQYGPRKIWMNRMRIVLFLYDTNSYHIRHDMSVGRRNNYGCIVTTKHWPYPWPVITLVPVRSQLYIIPIVIHNNNNNDIYYSWVIGHQCPIPLDPKYFIHPINVGEQRLWIYGRYHYPITYSICIKRIVNRPAPQRLPTLLQCFHPNPWSN